MDQALQSLVQQLDHLVASVIRVARIVVSEAIAAIATCKPNAAEAALNRDELVRDICEDVLVPFENGTLCSDPFCIDFGQIAKPLSDYSFTTLKGDVSQAGNDALLSTNCARSVVSHSES